MEGKKAPLFTGINQFGEKWSLKEHLGKKIILYFYPRDLTATCTIQACNLRDAYADFQKKGIAVIGVSTDEVKQHQKFIQKNNLPFTLIADTDHSIHEKYGVWQLKKFMGKEFMGTVRTTFLIDEKGIITHIIKKPKSKIHTQEINQYWNL